MRLAEFLRAALTRCRRIARRRKPRDDPHGSTMQLVRIASRAHIRRRSAADGKALLHEFRLAWIRTARLTEPSTSSKSTEPERLLKTISRPKPIGRIDTPLRNGMFESSISTRQQIGVGVYVSC